MRFHNKIADELHELNPMWDDERLYQESRRIIIAVFQHIAFNEYLPRTLGQSVAEAAGLRLLKTGYYKGYDAKCDATVANEFAAAAFRFGHTLVRK
jgi:peroxidase